MPLLAPSPVILAGQGVRPARSRSTWRDLAPALPDGAARLEQPFLWMRWGALAVGSVLVVWSSDPSRAVVAGVFLLAYTGWRTMRPIGFDRSGSHPITALLVEVAVVVAVVESTGFGRSPFLVSLAVAAAVAGFAGGVRFVAGLAGIAGMAVVLPSVILPPYRLLATTTTQFAIELVLVGVVGGLSRYLVEEALAARAGLAERVHHLTEVNDVLLGLHSAAMRDRTPAALDGTARWALERLEPRFGPRCASIVLRDPATGSWWLATDATTGPSDTAGGIELPAAAASAVEGSDPVVCDDLELGLSYRSRWAVYCPLRVNGELLGVLAVESEIRRDVSSDDLRSVGELAGVVALAVDNARWLERIHTLGIEEERTRLARELHDHVGQSVVYLGLEVDRLIDRNEGAEVHDDLVALRGDVRELVGELRDALVDLRSDVTETHGVDDVLAAFVERVNARSPVKVALVTDAPVRLPLSVEREFTRVAQEAVANAERHARASKISVLWRCREDGALLEVSDDGVGMTDRPAGPSAYGLVGMRERADSVRAKLEISSRRGEGTVVRMRKAVS